MPAVECGGDRVLVQKFLYDFRVPKRWEVAVFHYPGDPSQAYVKRVVGLPGESIRIDRGDVYADGRILRKTLDDQRAMRILVHDSRYEPNDSGRFPRWIFRSGWGYRSRSTGWSRTDRGFVHRARPAVGPGDWVIYQHWDPTGGRYGPVRDYYAYNGVDLPADNEVAGPGPRGADDRGPIGRGHLDGASVGVRPVRRPDPRGPQGRDRAGAQRRPGADRGPDLTRSTTEGPWPRTVTLEASAFDRRVMVAIDGKLLFDPYDYDRPRPGPSRRGDPDRRGG